MLFLCFFFFWKKNPKNLWLMTDENSITTLTQYHTLHQRYVVWITERGRRAKIHDDVGHLKNPGTFFSFVWFCTGEKLKVAFIQKGLMCFSFLQTDKTNYFPELKFDFFFHSKWLRSCQIRTWSCSNTFFEHSQQLHVLTLHDLNHLEWKENQNSSSGKY